MSDKHFRINRDTGRVTGISTMSLQLALANLGPDETLVPFDPSVNPKTAAWNRLFQTWETVESIEPNPEDDYAFMRSSGYPALGEQVGFLMKLLAVIFDDPNITQNVPEPLQREGRALLDRIDALKAAHPKPEIAA
jgi:hypothetical protein